MTSLRGWLRNPWLQLFLLLAAVSLALQVWQGREQQALGARVAQAAKPGDLRMISSTTCGVCTQARRWFTEHGVAFSECFVEHDAACRAELERWQAPGTPLILVRGRPQLGFSPARIEGALAATQAGG